MGSNYYSLNAENHTLPLQVLLFFEWRRSRICFSIALLPHSLSIKLAAVPLLPLVPPHIAPEANHCHDVMPGRKN